MFPDTYPFNLIRAIYNDPVDCNAHIEMIQLHAFFKQVKRLTDEQQEAIRLRFELGYTYKRGAEMCEVSLSNFRQSIGKAKRRLRRRDRWFIAIPQIEHEQLNETCRELTIENTQLKNAMATYTASGVNPVVMARVSSMIQPEKLLTPLYEIGLNNRTLTSVLRMSLRTVQDVLLTPTSRFTDEWGFGKVSLNDLQNAIRRHLLDIPPEHKQTGS